MTTPARRSARCLVVPKSKGEHFRRRLDALGFRDRSLKIRLDGNRLLLPLRSDVDKDTVTKRLKGRLSFAEKKFDAVRSRGERSLSGLLGDLEASKVGKIPRSYDIIGDIAIIELLPELTEDAPRIGEALLALHKRVKAVYSKASPVRGEYRLRDFRHIAGEERTQTTHRENGCQFKVNIATTFFNSRLGGERLRVSLQVSPSETVLDMFAGVGPFSILIAKRTRANVYSIDSNQEAIHYLRENIRLNHVGNNVKVMQGDAAHLAKKLHGRIDRVIMNLPERAIKYVATACMTLKPPGGILHFYSIQRDARSTQNAELLLNSRVEEAGYSIRKILFSKAIREIGPRTYQTVVDAEISA